MRYRAKLALWSALLMGVVACSSRHEEPPQRTRRDAVVGATATLSVSLPIGVPLRDIALSATSSIRISDRVQVRPEPGSDTAAVMSNTGPGETEIGADSISRDLRSFGSVVLRERATIIGDVVTQGIVTTQNAVTMTGSVTEEANLQEPREISRDFTFPGGDSVHREPDSPPLVLTPGAYGHVSVHSRSQVELTSGTYFFESLSFEPEAILRVDGPPDVPVLVYVKGPFSFKGEFQFTGDPGDLLFGLFGQEMISLETALSGTVVAPHATLRFAPAHKEFYGSFFAKDLLVEPDLAVVHVPFKHWGHVFPPVPFVTCVSQVAVGKYAALFGYENPLDTVEVVPRGSQNFLTPVVDSPDSEPLTVFQPGRFDQGFWSLLPGPDPSPIS